MVSPFKSGTGQGPFASGSQRPGRPVGQRSRTDLEVEARTQASILIAFLLSLSPSFPPPLRAEAKNLVLHMEEILENPGAEYAVRVCDDGVPHPGAPGLCCGGPRDRRCRGGGAGPLCG